MMLLYSIRHIDSIFGFGAPEPLARMYSRSFYRVTWIVTALDAGFATALNVKPLWLRDILSCVFAGYYLLFANEADEKLRRYRAFCTIDMMRGTWEKTTNPYIRAITWFHRPSLPIARPILLPRPTLGAHAKRPIKAWLFYAKGKEAALSREEELYLDFPGGGFICMDPRHHEERLRQLAKETQRPVLSIDYLKAPEHPYPAALEECFDVYRTLFETRGKAIGMSGSSRFRVIISGDSAGGNLATAVTLKVLEYPQPHIKSAYASLGGVGKPPPLPKPICMILAYPSLNFSFSAWLRPEHLRVLKAQSEVNLQSLQNQSKDRLNMDSNQARKGSPLRPRSRSRSRRSSLSASADTKLSLTKASEETKDSRKSPFTGASRKQPPQMRAMDKTRVGSNSRSYLEVGSQAELPLHERVRLAEADPMSDDWQSPTEEHAVSILDRDQEDLHRRLLAAEAESDHHGGDSQGKSAVTGASNQRKAARVLSTRLTMSSMSAYFQDRILTQSLMRSMAILYIGGRRQPDFETEYLLSPIVAPARLLAELPPVLVICGEKDPLCDDSVVFAGRVREAKLAKQAEIKRRRAGADGKAHLLGEHLRMSHEGDRSGLPYDPIEDEEVEDWVQMRIIASVSHGILQMSALFPEAKHIISFISAWVVDSLEFEKERLDEERMGSSQQLHANTKESRLSEAQSNMTDSVSAGSRLNVEARQRRPSGDDDEDDEAPLSFTPKRMRSPSMNNQARFASPSSPQGLAGASPLPPSPMKEGTARVFSSDRPLASPAVAALRAEGATSSYRSQNKGSGTESEGNGRESTGQSSAVSPMLRDASQEGSSARLSAPLSSGRSRPSSFSTIPQARSEIVATLLHPPGTEDGKKVISPTSGANRRRAFSPSVHRRSSFTGGTTAADATAGSTLDEKTRSLLVDEASLLRRRRDDALSDMGGVSSSETNRPSGRIRRGGADSRSMSLHEDRELDESAIRSDEDEEDYGSSSLDSLRGRR